ncbi:hypothetical protein [Aureispira sp. CCB-QB1]|uniref:hypothetical protein n=1 Tax=Aureispira sp. CCB-QB1 TaxID=1313421 RepID=UPI0006961FC5|nr:hypothetical protein [Aureispira sp. CCB-QB1]
MNQNENKEPEKEPLEDEKEELDDFPFLEDEDDSISPELDQFMKEQEADEISNDYDNLMNNWEEDEEEEWDDIEENESDPLTEFEGEPSSDREPPTEKVEQIKERISSEKNSKNIERLGAKFLDKADFFKASLCSKLSGQHMAEYVADDEMKAILIDCIKEYLATKEVSELSPFGALMAALAMWTLPPLGIALLDRFQLKKEEKQKTSTNLNQAATETTTVEAVEVEDEVQGEAQTDYSHLKEFQEKRKVFSVNADGKYNRVPNGKTYIKVDIADEFPSPEIQEWLEQGKKDREIRKLLGYGQ